MEEGGAAKKSGKQHNFLPLWGNESTMNLNPLVLANIQGSSYFKVHLFKLKTYHEVVDEIYYQVKHMEPWERGSRKTAGQTGMCGGVRGVGAGGIVSTAYCLLYKLYTLRLTRKQVNGLLNHTDSPYIRALGFMYLRYTQPPADLYEWYEDYLLDEEEIDVKAGGGQTITIGQMVYQFLTKLEWFSTLFPRIPVPIQKQIEKKIEDFCRDNQISVHQLSQARAPGGGAAQPCDMPPEPVASGQHAARRGGYYPPPAVPHHRPDYEDRDRGDRDRYGGGGGERDRDVDRYASSSSGHHRSASHRHRGSGERSPSEKHKKKRKHKHRSRTRSRSRSRGRHERQPVKDRDYDRHHTRSRDEHDERRYR